MQALVSTANITGPRGLRPPKLQATDVADRRDAFDDPDSDFLPNRRGFHHRWLKTCMRRPFVPGARLPDPVSLERAVQDNRAIAEAIARGRAAP